MSRNLSPAFKRAITGASTEEAVAVIATIDHHSLDAPVRVCSYPKRLSVSPLRYGLVSGGETYEFVLMSAVIPDDKRGAPPSSQLVFENVAPDMVQLVRSIDGPATVSLAVVLASSPDTIEIEFVGLKSTKATYETSSVVLDISREPMTSEPWPCDRMSKNRFPGMYR